MGKDKEERRGESVMNEVLQWMYQDIFHNSALGVAVDSVSFLSTHSPMYPSTHLPSAPIAAVSSYTRTTAPRRSRP
jgi:hypothetical protein